MLKTDVHRFECVRCKIAKTWLLHHDNAPSHTSIAVREFLAQHNITTLPHPPYNPVFLSPSSDRFLSSCLRPGTEFYREVM
jgi:hypothetical protein